MRIGLVSDLHWMQEAPSSPAAWHGDGEFAGVLERLERALELFAAEEVDRIVVSGDLSHHGDPDSALAVLRALEPASAPVLVVVGNHDLGGDGSDRLSPLVAEAAVPGVALARPEGESAAWLRIAGVHVGGAEGWFEASLARFDTSSLLAPEPLLLISHYPLLSLATEVAARGLPYPGDLLDRERVAAQLTARSEAAIVLGGHLHIRATTTAGPVLQLSAGALVEPPYECALVEIEQRADRQLWLSRRCLSLLSSPASRQPVLAPAEESWRFDPAAGAWQEQTCDPLVA